MAEPSDGDERSESELEIMRATYRALCDHGYANMTMQTIAEEYGKSTAAIHYYYDTKDDLLAAFLSFLLDKFIDRVHEVETTAPKERLDLLLDRLLTDREGNRDFMVAMLEMRAQAPYNDAVREQFQRNDEYTCYLLKTVIADGADSGVFTVADPEHAAEALMLIVDGARTRYASLEEKNALEEARETAREYVESVLMEE
ncbi:TetR family transcriptional regulator C-terminal domain-containing protein [Haladaptatus sp. CMAA 1911]|uniref:TetR family transcriptional regulator C-terminal domain-containing protein n=1 Tax=unclassified Haladaptatus TaxID=2622732 RepID=UPI00375540B8